MIAVSRCLGTRIYIFIFKPVFYQTNSFPAFPAFSGYDKKIKYIHFTCLSADFTRPPAFFSH
jgi:hypothetical protein